MVWHTVMLIITQQVAGRGRLRLTQEDGQLWDEGGDEVLVAVVANHGHHCVGGPGCCPQQHVSYRHLRGIYSLITCTHFLDNAPYKIITSLRVTYGRNSLLIFIATFCNPVCLKFPVLQYQGYIISCSTDINGVKYNMPIFLTFYFIRHAAGALPKTKISGTSNFLVDIVRYHSGGFMKLNACILLLAHMVYL